MKQPSWLAVLVALAFSYSASTHVVAQSSAAVAEKSAGRAAAAYDKNTPGVGPIRAEDWFVKTWRDRRAMFREKQSKQQHAIVFFGDSITQGWDEDFRGKFPGL